MFFGCRELAQCQLQAQLYNVDNYKSMVKEIYFKAKYKLANEWLDPPDWNNGPLFPPGHPGISDPPGVYPGACPERDPSWVGEYCVAPTD